MDRKNHLSLTAAIISLFFFMLILNLLTPLCVDDFTYRYSFADGSELALPHEIIPSMKIHGEKMNGRLIAHGLLQFTFCLPDWIFEMTNAAIFVLLLLLLCRTAALQIRGPLLFLLFGAFWLFCPAFGEVVLWRTGAVNYLWFLLFAMLFLLPYLSYFENGKAIRSPLWQAAFVLFAFPAGAYLENGSAAMIGMALLFLFAMCFSERKPKKYHIFALLVSLCGYFFMLTRPAELVNKAGGLSLQTIIRGFREACAMYFEFMPLFLLFAVLLPLAILKRKDPKKLASACIFAAGSLAANFIMSAASYYPARCALPSAFFLLLAASRLITLCFFPLPRSLDRIKKVILALLLAVSLIPILMGTTDIFMTGHAMKQADIRLSEAAQRGEKEVTLPILKSKTKYGVLFELKYLDKDPESWPNHDMAKTYGLQAVYGKYEQIFNKN